MTFLILGMKNARRNLARSVIAIFSMAIAAGFLTYSASLTQGYPRLMNHDYRAIIGGEIVVYSAQFDGIIPEGNSTWTHERPVHSPLTDMEIFHPQLFRQGALSLYPHNEAFSPSDIETLLGHEAVHAVYPRYQMPADLHTMVGARKTPLRGRSLSIDSQLACPPESLLSEGRWFAAEDEGKAVAIVSDYQHFLPGEPIPQVGDTIVVHMPKVRYIEGSIAFDWLDPWKMELLIIGKVEIITRHLNASQGTPEIPVFWQNDEIHIPQGTWETIWTKAGGQEYRPEQLSLLVEDTTYLEDHIAALRDAFPQRTFLSVPSQAAQAQALGLIETPVPGEYTLPLEQTQQPVVHMDVRLPMSILIFANAALVVSANLLMMVGERTKEIGILKAVGSRRRQIMAMVMAEALLISCMGTLAGFTFFRIPVLLNQLTNLWGILPLLASLLVDSMLVFFAATVASALFALMPAWKMASMSAAEVLRSE